MTSSKNKLGIYDESLKGSLFLRPQESISRQYPLSAFHFLGMNFLMGVNISNKEYNFFIISETDE